MLFIEPVFFTRMSASGNARSVHAGAGFSLSGLHLPIAVVQAPFVSGNFAHGFGSAHFVEVHHFGVRHVRPTQLLALDFVEGYL